MRKTLFVTALLTTLTLTATAHADGGDGAGPGTPGGVVGKAPNEIGGHAACGQFGDTATKIIAALGRVTQPEIDKTNSMIKISELQEVKKKLTCVPVTTLDRQLQAASDPNAVQTKLLFKSWFHAPPIDRIRLTAHELAVLAQYENSMKKRVSMRPQIQC